MALRMLLVVLVAGLGLELPSRGEGNAGARAGGDRQSPGPVEPVAVTDQAFAAVVEEMVSTFATGPGRDTETGAEACLLAGEEEEEGLYPGLAYALNREAEGLSGSIAPATGAEVPAAPSGQEEMAVMPPAPGDEALTPPNPYIGDEELFASWMVDDLAVMPPAPETEAPAAEPAPISRGERLLEAIQLTGAAVHAWVTFLQQPPAVVPDRP